MIRLLSDSDNSKVILLLDGIGAFDHIRRAEIFKALMNDPELRPLLPYVHLWYNRQSTFL